ncbi:hypothetical protein E8E14_000233 [Neopestalotiopsis sp. 37M]|nr:hypothetical protein E8E14_000233 [Neopestalotiopsis sp. 37M]
MTGFKYLNQAAFLEEPYQPAQTPARDDENSSSSAPDGRTRSGSFYQQSNRSRPSFSMFRYSNDSRSNTSLYGQSNQSRPNLSFLSNDGDSPTASVRTVDQITNPRVEHSSPSSTPDGSPGHDYCVGNTFVFQYPTDPSNMTNSRNIKSGTVVDRGVTSARVWDFFLTAHTALQGTARSAHYRSDSGRWQRVHGLSIAPPQPIPETISAQTWMNWKAPQ